MPRPIEAVIHSGALRHNLEVARGASPASRVFAVVKANAYGHGLPAVVSGLADADGMALVRVMLSMTDAGSDGPPAMPFAPRAPRPSVTATV